MDEDMILPDDFQEDTTPEEVTEQVEETPVETVEDTTPTEPTETLETPQTIKIKYNHEEQEISYDEAIPLIQKGMNFDKALERSRQEARDAWIAEQNYEWNGRPITTESEYKQALMEQELISKYQDRDLPPEVIQELVESRRFREESKKALEEKTKEEQKNHEYMDFFDYFRQSNGRDFVPSQDNIPDTVLQMAEEMPLKFAYMMHENQQLRTQLNTLKQNETNAKRAPVNATTIHGGNNVTAEDDFLRGFNSI